MPLSNTEPKGSDDSSNDELCFCGHKRGDHYAPGTARDYSGCKAEVVDSDGFTKLDDCMRFRLAPPLREPFIPLHHFVPGERNAAMCGGTDCGQPEDGRMHSRAPLGGQTVSEGPQQGDVCVGRGRSWVGQPCHRPVVRAAGGLCFICHPLAQLPGSRDVLAGPDVCEKDHEAIAEEEDVRTYCDECGCWDGYHEREAGCTECCECRVGEAVRPPDICEIPHATQEEEDACEAARIFPHGPYSIRYAVEGGQQYTLLLPGGTNVTIEDGIVRISHARLAVGIVAVHT